MFNKIPTELRKFEYPMKPHHLITTTAELRNVTYRPRQQVRQPINIVEPVRQVPIYSNPRLPSQHVPYPPARSLYVTTQEEKQPEPEIPFSPFTVNSKLQNDINTIEQQSRSKHISPRVTIPATKSSDIFDRELSPIRNYQEPQVEADPVVANLSRSMEKRSTSTRKYPIFNDSKQQLSKSIHKTPIFEINHLNKPSRSPHRVPIFKTQSGLTNSNSKIIAGSRQRIFENSKNDSALKSNTTESNLLHELNDHRKSEIFREPRQQIRSEAFLKNQYTERQFVLTKSPTQFYQQSNFENVRSPLTIPVYHYPSPPMNYQQAQPQTQSQQYNQRQYSSAPAAKSQPQQSQHQPQLTLSPAALQARKQGNSKPRRPKVDPTMLIMVSLGLVTVFWFIYEMYMNFG